MGLAVAAVAGTASAQPATKAIEDLKKSQEATAQQVKDLGPILKNIQETAQKNGNVLAQLKGQVEAKTSTDKAQVKIGKPAGGAGDLADYECGCIDYHAKLLDAALTKAKDKTKTANAGNDDDAKKAAKAGEDSAQKKLDQKQEKLLWCWAYHAALAALPNPESLKLPTGTAAASWKPQGDNPGYCSNDPDKDIPNDLKDVTKASCHLERKHCSGGPGLPNGPDCEPAFWIWWQAPTNLSYRWFDRHVLFFDASGKSIAQLPQVDENDTLIVVVVSGKADTVIDDFTITQCSPPDPFRIGGSAKAGSTPTLEAEKASQPAGNTNPANFYYRIQVASRCSAAGGLKAKVKQGQEHEIKVDTLPIYNLTLGLGFVYDFTRTTDYKTASVKGQSVPVITADEHAEGLTPAVLFLSWRFTGVDTARTRWIGSGQPGTNFLEWFGLSVGFRLTDPLHHFYLGGLIEPYPGFGFTAGAHFHAVNTLASGYQVGDRFPAGGDVPVDKRWDIKATNAYMGVIVDASVFGQIFGLFR
jgi:hypothetical protein